VIKVTVNIPEDLMENVKRLAAEEGTTMTSVIQRALSLEIFLAAEEEKGSKVLLEDPNGKFRKVMRK